MLIERISNPWFQFKVLQATLQGEEKGHLAKNAFLYVINEYNAYSSQKEKILNEITETYPDITEAVCDEDMLEHFQYFCQKARRRNEIVSPVELDWVNKFVRNATIRVRIEKLIYRIVLGASSHWDKMRHDFSWTISDDEKLELVREVLLDKGVGSKRKLELAQEFGQPKDDFARPYYRKLLYDRHYDKADELGVSDSEIVLDVIVANVDNGYFRDALDIAQRFLPERKDLAEEIQQIIAVFNG